MISREFPLTFLILALTVFGNAQERSLEAAKAEFTKADQGLNQIYTEAKSTLPEWTFGDLQQDQREWLEYRDLRAEQATQTAEDDLLLRQVEATRVEMETF